MRPLPSRRAIRSPRDSLPSKALRQPRDDGEIPATGSHRKDLEQRPGDLLRTIGLAPRLPNCAN
uniref:Uncharacterized protein n=1 Tax=Macrostomum lignano TaxID=282301 RepID=A0A1I8G499_9PLAT